MATRSASLPAAAGALAVISLCGVWLAGCDAPANSENNGKSKFRIVTTCGMVTDIVRQIAGEKAEVVGLLGAGVDPHIYNPTGNDVKQLNQADVVFYSGLTLEGRMGELFTQVARGGKPVYAVTEALDRSLLREPPEFLGHYDPHVWMDVSLWTACTEFVAKSLSEYDPPNADYYRQNLEAYRPQLARLDEYVRQVIASIPEDQRVLVTAHDAFGYFSQAYGIPVQSVQGTSTDSEAGMLDINRLIDFIVDRKLSAIFVESSVSKKNIQAIIEGAAQRGLEVGIGGELFSDAMGPFGTYEGTYIGMIDHNATVITRALGGEAPEGGLNGKLAPPKTQTSE